MESSRLLQKKTFFSRTPCTCVIGAGPADPNAAGVRGDGVRDPAHEALQPLVLPLIPAVLGTKFNYECNGNQ